MNMAAPLLALELVAGAGQARPGRTGWRDALGVICYGQAMADDDADDVPCAAVAMPVLGGGASVCEVWRSAGTPSGGRHGAVSYRQDGNLLFGCLRLNEGAPAGGDTPLRAAARDAYSAIFAAADAFGYPHLVRFWNYFPEINREVDGLERYRQFNIGRQEGFGAGNRALDANLPAACALGTRDGPLVVAFLAAREAPIAVENPRQVPAYDYPPEYGPRSPTFARASLLACADGEILLISGTASIVGHRTLHVGDAAAQTAEAMANLRALIGAANGAGNAGGFALADLALKVYVRDARDLEAIRGQVEAAPDAPRQVAFLRADICRQDLLVEIEGTAHSRSGAPAAGA
jgi:enamine deaminase RidA (YjgF/YER057c/UK114 family)